MRGIYRLSNSKTNMKYIGSSKDIFKRWKAHIDELIHKRHHNYKIQEDFDKYGFKSFRFEIVELLCDTDDLLEHEQMHIDNMMQSDYDNCYNLNPCARLDYSDNIIEYTDVITDMLKSTKSKLKKNIKIASHAKFDDFDTSKHAYSKSWFFRASKATMKQIRNHIHNVARHYWDVGRKEYFVGSYSFMKVKIRDDKFSSRMVINLNHTSENKKQHLFFLANCFFNSFKDKKKEVDNDDYALNVLVNWIMCNADINKPIDIYIPSSRMRNLLQDWLDSFKT